MVGRLLKQHVVAQSFVRADPLGDDCAHYGVGGGDFDAGEQGRQGAGQLQLGEDLPFARAGHLHIVHHGPVALGQTAHGSDGDREEADERNQHNLRQQPEAEPDDQQRGQGNRRHVLAEDQQRIERPLQPGQQMQQQRYNQADACTDREADQGKPQGGSGV
ncbi:hypothetical protein D3C73_1063040 [compost metagenome]